MIQNSLLGRVSSLQEKGETLKNVTRPQENAWTFSTMVTREYSILGFEEVPSQSPGCH